MFKRRIPKTPLQNAREWVWPSMGWVRAYKYIKHRILRMSDSTHKIAAGLANGAVISFTPLIGTHFIQALVLSYFMSANYLAAIIGTFWGNPWTFPFLWILSYNVGVFSMSIVGFSEFAALPDHLTFELLWQIFTDKPLKLFVPWLVGGYLVAIVTWPLFYFLSFYAVRTAQLAKKARRLKKLRREAASLTHPRTEEQQS